MRFRSLPVWPRPDTYPRRSRNVFSASWTQTMDLLERELDLLGAENVVIQAGFTDDEIRLDGYPRAGANPRHPGIILSFESIHGPMQYLTDAHEFWQHNVRAIALGLEALRAVDRYGITTRAEQYQGWKMLTAGSGLTSRDQALKTLRDLGDGEFLLGSDLSNETTLRSLYRLALKRAHPDRGGSRELFAAVLDAGRILGVRE